MEASEWPEDNGRDHEGRERDDGRASREGHDGADEHPDPYLPPEQRWWRHPSELGGPGPAGPGTGGDRAGAAPPALLPAHGSGSRAVLVLAVTIGVAGAVMAAYIAHLAHPATEDVARPLVRVTAASTLLTVAPSTAAPTSAMPGVVQVLLPAASAGKSGTAAAVGDGRLVTSAELVDGVTEVTAVMADGTEQTAKVVWVDTESGTAVLEIGEPTPTLASGRAATLDPGDTVTAAGTNIPGEVLAVGVKVKGRDGSRMEHLMRLRMDAPVENGAVLLDDDGNAVGICVGHEDADESTALAAPIELAKAATAGAGDDGTRQFAWLGMTGKSVAVDEAPAPATSTTLATTTSAASSTTAASTTVASSSTAAPPTAQPESSPPTTTAAVETQRPERGAQVVAIDPDGAAALGGLLTDDIVIAVDDVPVSSMNALILLVRERKVGDTIHLTVIRGGETVELEAVLKDRPAADAP